MKLTNKERKLIKEYTKKLVEGNDERKSLKESGAHDKMLTIYGTVEDRAAGTYKSYRTFSHSSMPDFSVTLKLGSTEYKDFESKLNLLIKEIIQLGKTYQSKSQL